MKRLFSTTNRLRQYAHPKHKEKFGQGKRLDKINQIEEGMNEWNTDIVKPYGKKPGEALKPIQHPKNLYDTDTAIVNYNAPPKNLTPYYHIPEKALVSLTQMCK